MPGFNVLMILEKIGGSMQALRFMAVSAKKIRKASDTSPKDTQQKKCAILQVYTMCLCILKICKKYRFTRICFCFIQI